MKKHIIATTAVGVSCLLLAACTPRPEPAKTTVAETSMTETTVAEPIVAETAPNYADAAQVTEYLKKITSQPHSAGSPGETLIVNYLESTLTSMGYETSTQPFTQKSSATDQADLSGTNVIAIKPATQNPDTADILVISAHHDGKPGIQAADDNASGVAALLETARLVKDLPADTELRFVSFSAEEDGRIGSRYYVESLTEEEKSRIIGNIQLDELGYYRSGFLTLSTSDGKETLLGNLLSETAGGLAYEKDDMSDHHSFWANQIPAVMLSEDCLPFENHSTQDTIDIVNVNKLTLPIQIVTDTLRHIMSEETGFLKEEAYLMNPVKPGLVIQRDTLFYFGMDRNFVENMMGISGTLIKSEENDYGDLEETYSYPLVWFDMEEATATEFHYRRGYLESINIGLSETGRTFDQAKELLTRYQDKPTAYELEHGTEYDWDDAIYHKYYSLTPLADGAYDLTVIDSNFGKIFHSEYDLSKGFDALSPEYPEDGKLLDILEAVIYPDDLAMIHFTPYTDGRHNSTGFTGGLDENNNTQLQYALDYQDAFDENGNFRNYNQTIRTIVHEYGHAIAVNASQLDITNEDDTLPNLIYPTETAAEDAYLRAYYLAFWTELDVSTGGEHYLSNPTDFVDKYASTDINEDFAETFMLFVLSDKPEDDTIASQKIRFFYDYDELIARRDYIRENLGIR